MTRFFGSAVFAVVLLLGAGAAPVQASSLTQTQISSILALLSAFGADSATIASVSTALNGGTPTTKTDSYGSFSCHNFNTNLKLGDGGQSQNGQTGVRARNAIDDDVAALIIVLSKEGLLNYNQVVQPGSAGTSIKSNYFSETIASAITAFQEKYASEILTPNLLQHGTGYVGASTRTKLNALYSCGVATTITPSVTVTYPNGGETVKYGDIYMAGDLYFNWTTSQKEKYAPTSNIKAYITDANGKVVRDDPVLLSITNLGGGIFRTSFVGEKNLVNGKYKIKVCDYLDSKQYCDSSDNYFVIQ